MQENTRVFVRFAGEIIYRNGGEVRVRRDDGEVFGAVCYDEAFGVGDRVTFRLLDQKIAVEFRNERA